MEIREIQEQNSVSIRVKTPVEKLPEVFGKGYMEIMQYLGELSVQPIGAPYAMYFNEDMSNLDIEIGFPVAKKQPEKGHLKPGKIPGGKTLITMHTGPYNEVEKSYNKIITYSKQEGIALESFCYEVYLNDPRNTPPEQLQTEICFPIKS